MMDYIVYTLAPLIAVLAIILYAIGLMVSAARQHPEGILKYKKSDHSRYYRFNDYFSGSGHGEPLIQSYQPLKRKESF